MAKELFKTFTSLKQMTKIEPVVDVNDLSRISAGTVIEGNMSCNGDVRVDGVISGTLYSSGKIVVGESAQISGTVLCNTVDFWGKMDGDIYVKDVMSLKNTAEVTGNIHVQKFQVEMGARINGSFKMITEEEFDKVLASTTAVKAK